MKVILLTLSIFAGTTLVTQAQSKAQVVAPKETAAVQSQIGPSKFSEVEPISYTAEPNRKMIRLRTNARRTEPVIMPVEPETQLSHSAKQRVEGKLAHNSGAAFK